MIIAGLTGGIGYGKTTFADLLAAQGGAAQHFESWQLVAEVAEPLKSNSEFTPAPDDIAAINRWLEPMPELVATHTHTKIPFETIQLTPKKLAEQPELYAKLLDYLGQASQRPKLTTTPIDDSTKETFRTLLQWVGGFLAVSAEGIWYNEMARRIKLLSRTDVRLITVGGLRFPIDAEILRNAGGVILEITRPSTDQRDKSDLTERERSLIQPDSIIVNDADLHALADCAKQVWHDLTRRTLQPEYVASQAMTSAKH